VNYPKTTRPPLIPKYLPPPSIVLRDYQEQTLIDIDNRVSEGHKRIAVYGPPGSGKTSIMAAVARRNYDHRIKTTLLLPFNCLITKSSTELGQTCGALERAGLAGHYGVYSGAFPGLRNPNAPIQVVTLQSLKNVHDWLADSQCIIIDEGHTGAFFAAAELAYKDWNWQLILNFTATMHNRSMGVDERHGDLLRNTALVKAPSYKALESRGYLAPLRYHTVFRENPAKVGNDLEPTSELKIDLESDSAVRWMLKSWLEECQKLNLSPMRAIGFTKANRDGNAQSATIQRIARDEFGLTFHVVGDGCNQADYERYMADYDAGLANLLCVQALSTGWDSPASVHCLLFRPIKSRDRAVQCATRVDRPSPETGKKYGEIWDFCSNFDLVGDGSGLHPTVERLSEEIDSTVLETKSKGGGEAPMKPCCGCGKQIFAVAMVCPLCGAGQPQKDLLFADGNGKLVSFIPESACSDLTGRIAYFRQWRKIAYLKAWKPYAAAVKLKDLGLLNLEEPAFWVDKQFWLGSIFDGAQGAKPRYRSYLVANAKRWGWDEGKINAELRREFGE
jgi:superfamily II DNA or RNA helicase